MTGSSAIVQKSVDIGGEMDEETAAAEDDINGFIAQWEHQRMLQDPAARREIYMKG